MGKKEEISELYALYGFEIGDSNADSMAFLSNEGYFPNAEIVQLSNLPTNATRLKEEYEQIGYSSRILKYNSLEDLHKTLFNGFFNIEHINKKQQQEYLLFCQQQAKSLCGGKYEYIAGSYLKNNNFENNDLIAEISDVLTDSTIKSSAHLVILEAAAGYGKTCTSYEIVSKILAESSQKIPLLAELSKNRKATVFRYVLLSEIDKKFHSLSSKLVTSEIKAGRIPLIVDGFDELLSKTDVTNGTSEPYNTQDAQTMLETIAQLLGTDSHAKILLTTRKSSFITGELFDSFVENQLKDSLVTRIQLLPPSINLWIGVKKVELLKNLKIDIRCISSPVLLSMLRYEQPENYPIKYHTIDDILSQYFEILLKREQTRQSLMLSNDEQLTVMQQLAAYMVELDISAEEIDFIKFMIEEIMDPKLSEYIKRYKKEMLMNDLESIPTKEALIGVMSHHALLDRVSANTNKIGFINEFIFGIMISNAVTNHFLSAEKLQGKYLDIVLAAAANRGKGERERLFTALKPILKSIPPFQRLSVDMNLMGALTTHYSDQYWDGLTFENDFCSDGQFHFRSCTFAGCTFKGCILYTDAFHTCQFYNCQFYNIQVNSGDILNCQLMFIGCKGHEKFEETACRLEPISESDINYERIVLQQFWKPGYEMAEPKKAYRTLFKGVTTNNRADVASAIKNLIERNILMQQIYTLELNFGKMDEIKQICER